MDNILYINCKTGKESRAKHVIIDESNFTHVPMPPGALRLARISGRAIPEFLRGEVQPLQQSAIIMIPNTYFERITIILSAAKTLAHGFILQEDVRRNRMYVTGAKLVHQLKPSSASIDALRVHGSSLYMDTTFITVRN